MRKARIDGIWKAHVLHNKLLPVRLALTAWQTASVRILIAALSAESGGICSSLKFNNEEAYGRSDVPCTSLKMVFCFAATETGRHTSGVYLHKELAK